jgi:hypothetical protein
VSEDKPLRPWDIFNKNVAKILPIEKEKRLSICSSCPEFISLSKMCKQCGCFMPSKVKLAGAECPLGKWGQMNVSLEKEADI